MNDRYGPERLAMSGYARTAMLYFAASLVPTAILLLLRGRLGVLNTASWLVVYGVLVAMGEHAGWAIRLRSAIRSWSLTLASTSSWLACTPRWEGCCCVSWHEPCFARGDARDGSRSCSRPWWAGRSRWS